MARSRDRSLARATAATVMAYPPERVPGGFRARPCDRALVWLLRAERVFSHAAPGVHLE